LPVFEGHSRELLILVPAYNEELSLGLTLDSIRYQDPALPILVVDDGSVDSTSAVARSRGATLLTLPRHLGLGGAVQTGYKLAWEEGFENVIRMDADGQHPPEEIPALLHALKTSGCEVVIGSRFVGELWRAQEGLRGLGTRLFRFMLRPILGRWVYDPTSGFIGVNRKALSVFAAAFPLEYPEIEMLVVLQRRTFRFLEVPCEMRPRIAGSSTLTPKASFYYMVHVLLGFLMNVLRFPGFGARRGGANP
jgi:glycosyltransferase involved in cell wall biosynthesis